VEIPEGQTLCLEKPMNLINFIVWLSAGAVIGWFASRMIEIEQRQRTARILSVDERKIINR
jgi:hypothetical protein